MAQPQDAGTLALIQVREMARRASYDRSCSCPCSPARSPSRRVSQLLVEEKRRALEQAAPRVSLQPTGGAAAPAAMDEEVASVAQASVADSSDRRSVGSSAPNLHRSSEAAQLRAMRLQQELLLREAEECTFHPRVNTNRPIKPSKGPPPTGTFFSRSQQWAAQVAEGKESRRRTLERAKMADCTFSPAVTPRRPSSAAPSTAKTRRTSLGSSGIPAPGSAAPGSAAPKSVVDRLYQPQQMIVAHQEQERLREERRQESEVECSFQPSINQPLRSNQSTNVSSRYRRPSPAPSRPRPLPTGAEECTFSPAVNRTPRALSSAVSEYLDDPAYMRLSRAPPASPRPSDFSPPGNGGPLSARSLQRSSSAPRERMSIPGSPGGEEVFNTFLERQQAHLQRKRVAEAKRAEAKEAELSSIRKVGQRKLDERLSSAYGKGDGEEGEAISFLDRVAEATRRRYESSQGGPKLPSEHVEHCSFRPVITQAAHARRARTVEELSTGEVERRLRSHDAKKMAQQAETSDDCTFAPNINDVPGVQSRLKVTTEPGSYLARVRQHMKLKEQLTACVREAQESQELAECTFHPTTHEAPAYISRIAKSVRMAKQSQPPPAPVQPGWR